MNNKLIERNLQKQINEVMQQIRSCKDEEFDSLVYKYNIYNNIKNTFDEEIVETKLYEKILEEDKEVLEKIYSKFLRINMIFSPRTFDDVMLESFLTEIKVDYMAMKEEQKTVLIDIFRAEYEQDPSYNGMIPSNSTKLQNYPLTLVYELIKEGILQERNCSGLAFELTDEYKKEIKQEREEDANEDEL